MQPCDELGATTLEETPRPDPTPDPTPDPMAAPHARTPRPVAVIPGQVHSMAVTFFRE